MRRILFVALIWIVAAQMAFAEPKSKDMLWTTSVWQFFPSYGVGEGDRGLGMIPLFADEAAEEQVGGINFYCTTTRGRPYLDIFAYAKRQTDLAEEQEHRWLSLTAQTVLRVGNVAVPVSIEGGFVYIDITPRTEYLISRLFDISNISGDRSVERILEVPGFVTLKLVFLPRRATATEADERLVSFAEMLDLCNAARASVAPTPRKVPRR
jgi:hypothetical protein